MRIIPIFDENYVKKCKFCGDARDFERMHKTWRLAL